MEELYEKLYIDGLPMKPVGMVLGVLLLATHLYALLQPAKAQRFLKAFPRHPVIGTVLLIIVAAWSWFLVREMDMGEFWKLRKLALFAIPVLAVAIIFYANEFLSVRALGSLMLLVAAVVLQSAFQKEPWIPKLLLPILSYAWILLGLFWVGMPYLMRDTISWVTENSARWKTCVLAGLAYGALLLVVAFLYYP